MKDLTTVNHWDTVRAGMEVSTSASIALDHRDARPAAPASPLRPAGSPLSRSWLRAPGKLLAWVAANLKADVAGLDYSEIGLATARRLFDALHLSADFRCEDLRQTTFAPESFDVVLSIGVIEHFDDPRGVVNEVSSEAGETRRYRADDHDSWVLPPSSALLRR